MPRPDLAYLILGLLMTALALLLCLFLLLGPGKGRQSNRILAAVLGLIALQYLNVFVNGLWLENSAPLYNYALSFLLAPLILLYARSLLGKPLKWERDWFHFLPFAIVGLIGLIPGQLILLRPSYWAIAPQLYLLAYIIPTIFYLQKRRAKLKQIRSNLPAGQVSMLTLIFGSWAAKAILAIAKLLLLINGWTEPGLWLDIAILVVDAAIIAGFAIVVTTPEEPVRPLSLKDEKLAEDILLRPPPEPKDIREDAAFFKQIDVLLQQEKLFLDPGLSLPLLSELLKSPPEKVGRAIHNVGGQSFFDYINSYRILAAQGLMVDKEKKLSLREVMHAVGFHSRPVFNAAFRKVAGMTPSQFKKKNR